MVSLIERIPHEAVDCRRCGLWEGRTQVVWGEGPVPCDIMLLGEAPGPEEDRVGRPFIGRAGKVLERLLGEAGLSRDMVYIANRAKCFPGYTGSGIGKPSVSSLAACEPWLQGELQTVVPKAVVAMGATALTLPFPGHSVGRAVGLRRAIGETVWIATYHPTYVARGNADAAAHIVEALREAVRYANTPISAGSTG